MRTSNGPGCQFLPTVLALWLLSSCGGGGGGGDEGTPGAPITSFELLDPTPGAGNQFGATTVILANGNIVVASPFDSSVASGNGAVHLYDSVTQKRIASSYGDAASDKLGSGGVVALPNGNFVVVSPSDDVSGIVDGGSVRLVNGTTGLQIGAAIAGDVTGDALGSGGVTALPNGNFVIVSPKDDVGGIVDAGSVRLVDGATGLQIGAAIVGDTAGDQVGAHVTALTNGNFVIVSPRHDVGGILDAGLVRLVSGTTGAQIGSAIAGDRTDDKLGSFSGIAGVTELANGNFVIATSDDNEGGIVFAGSVRLVSGTTGAQIGSTIAGDVAGDGFSSSGIVPLASGNFVIVSPFDKVGGIFDAGSVLLVSGTTGLQIGSAFTGNFTNDLLSTGGMVISLANGNFVIASPAHNPGGIANAGSVRLVNGTTGAQIGSAIDGDAVNDLLGSGGVFALANGNFVIVSPFDDVGGIVDAGSVRLVSGTTGLQIGTAIAGDGPGDGLGSSNGFFSSGVTALANGNFVIVSPLDDVGSIVDAGSVRLVNGMTGVQIGSAIAGDAANDFLSSTVVELPNGDFVIASPGDDVGGIVDAGSVRLVSGTSGAQMGDSITGSAANDGLSAYVTVPVKGNYYIMSMSMADRNGLTDSGLVRLIGP